VAANGGTGQSLYAVGDLLYASTTTALSKLADVATGNALISGGVGVAPSWGKIGLTTHVSGTLPTANGGTNLTSFTANGVVYASSSSALATGSALTFDGTNLSSTGGATFEGGPIGYGGGEIRLGSTSASLQNGISTQGTGTPQIIFDHRGTSNTGTFTWRNGTGGANTLLFLGATGNMLLNTTTNKTTAFSGNGTGLTIGGALAPTLALYDTTNTAYVFNLTQIDADSYLYNTANGFMAFGTNNAETMRISSAGNVGIGTTLQKGTKLNVMGGDIVPATSGTTQNGGLRVSSLTTGNGGYVLDMGVSDTNGYAWMQVSNSGNLASGFAKPLVIQPVGGVMGLGVVPTDWSSSYKALQINTTSNISATSNTLRVGNNEYVNTSAIGTYLTTGFATTYLQNSSGQHVWYNAPSGTAGNAITFTQAMTLDASGNLLVGTTTSTAKSNITQTSAARVQSITGNSNSQGNAQLHTVVRQYSVVSLGTKLIIPFTSQTSLNSTTLCKIFGLGARYNANTIYNFEINFAVAHLNSLSNLTSYGGQGNYASIAVNGMNIEITFTSAYTAGTADGVYVTIQYMTNNVSYSIDVPNIAMN
jgi:hypothetical protein